MAAAAGINELVATRAVRVWAARGRDMLQSTVLLSFRLSPFLKCERVVHIIYYIAKLSSYTIALPPLALRGRVLAALLQRWQCRQPCQCKAAPQLRSGL
eukprot:354126-Chlamydomonas_euryale.AAC.1